MKMFLFALALIFTAHLASAQDDYVLLSRQEYYDPTIQSLEFFGWKYVLEKGIFQSSKVPLDNGMWLLLNIVSIEKKTVDEVDYYRFTVYIGLDYDEHEQIKTSYIVSHRPSNGRFVVSSWAYTQLPTYDQPSDEEYATGPENSFIDVRPLNNGTSDLSPLLDSTLKAVVKDAIKQGSLPDAQYSLRFVYSAENVNETTPPTYDFLVSIVSSDGNFYGVRTQIQENDNSGETPKYEINPYYLDGTQW